MIVGCFQYLPIYGSYDAYDKGVGRRPRFREETAGGKAHVKAGVLGAVQQKSLVGTFRTVNNV